MLPFAIQHRAVLYHFVIICILATSRRPLLVLSLLVIIMFAAAFTSPMAVQATRFASWTPAAVARAVLSTSAGSAAAAVSSLKGKDFMCIDQLTKSELQGLLDLSMHYKQLYADKSAPNLPRPLTGYSMSMIFQKRSTRTRVSTETGMAMLGGHALFLGPSDIQLGVNESMRDTANVLCRFNQLILARVFGHADVEELAKYSDVPVINALSDLHHPLQTLADLMTLQEHFGRDGLKGKTLAWVGDGNNVLHDLMLGSALLGMHVNVATPTGYEPNAAILERTHALAKISGSKISQTTLAAEAVQGAHVVVTDTWVSMGQESEYAKRVAEFDGYQVNSKLMAQADPGAVFLHCLPRHKEEVTDEVIYSKQSLVFPEAENRMWTVMAVMAAQLGKFE